MRKYLFGVADADKCADEMSAPEREFVLSGARAEASPSLIAGLVEKTVVSIGGGGNIRLTSFGLLVHRRLQIGEEE